MERGKNAGAMERGLERERELRVRVRAPDERSSSGLMERALVEERGAGAKEEMPGQNKTSVGWK